MPAFALARIYHKPRCPYASETVQQKYCTCVRYDWGCSFVFQKNEWILIPSWGPETSLMCTNCHWAEFFVKSFFSPFPFHHFILNFCVQRETISNETSTKELYALCSPYSHYQFFHATRSARLQQPFAQLSKRYSDVTVSSLCFYYFSNSPPNDSHSIMFSFSSSPSSTSHRCHFHMQRFLPLRLIWPGMPDIDVNL